MLKFLKNPCNIYISLLTFYSMQGTMIPTGGSALSQMIVLVTMLMGLYYTVKVVAMKGKPVYFNGLNLLFFIFVVYGLVLLFSDHHYVVKGRRLGGEVSNFTYLKSILLSFPNIYAFYFFSIKKYLTENLLKRWIFVFMGAAVFIFIDFQMTTIQELLLEGMDVDEVTNNVGYLFVALIPSVALFKHKSLLQYGMIIFCMAFIVMGMKRGAIIVGVLLVLYFLYFNYRYHQSMSKAKVLFFSILIVFAVAYIVGYMMESSDYFMARIAQTEEGGTSGRDEIYDFFWGHFKNEPDVFKFFLGNGANATLGIGVNYAHNDWLEIAINQGVLGLMAYAFYWLCFLKTIWNTKHNNTARLVLSLCFISFFIMTIFSMSYTEYSMMACATFGYSLACCQTSEEAEKYEVNSCLRF